MSDREGAALEGVWCTLGEPRTAAQIGRGGFAWIALDMQHGVFDDTSLIATMQGLASLAQPPLIAVRIAELSDAAVGRALDVGADVVIVPMVETVHQAQHAVRAAHYPPRGRRSWGSLVGLWGREVPMPAESDPEVWVMIETSAGLDAVDEILSVPGVTAGFVGPFDLSISLGIDLDDLLRAHEAADPLPRVIAAARRAHKSTGVFAGDAERADLLRTMGFDRIAVATDSAVLTHGAAAILRHTPGRRNDY